MRQWRKDCRRREKEVVNYTGMKKKREKSKMYSAKVQAELAAWKVE